MLISPDLVHPTVRLARDAFRTAARTASPRFGVEATADALFWALYWQNGRIARPAEATAEALQDAHAERFERYREALAGAESRRALPSSTLAAAVAA